MAYRDLRRASTANNCRMPDLQCPVDADVSLFLIGWANMQLIGLLGMVSTYSLLLLERREAVAQSV